MRTPIHMNIIKPVINRILPVLEAKIPSKFHRAVGIRHPIVVQLEFPWTLHK